MSKYPPYLQRAAGDIVTSEDWNRLQELIREEVRQHRHEGGVDDTNRLDGLGTRLDNPSLAEGAIDEQAFADGAVTSAALQEQALADWAVAQDAAIDEKENLLFEPDAGHQHDGVTSTPLARSSVGPVQLADGAVTNDKLAPGLLDEIAAIERLLAVPQALSVSAAAGSTGDIESFTTIVGHGFGEQPGVVRLLKVLPDTPGAYQSVQQLEIAEWTNNEIRVLLPEDPTGLFQVEVDGLPLNPLAFDESLAVTDAVPDHLKLDVEVNSNIQITFSTELMATEVDAGAEGEPELMVLYPGETEPRLLEQRREEEDAPVLDLPIEIYHGDGAERLNAALSLSRDRKTVTLTHAMARLPWNTPFVIRVYGEEERGLKPLLLAANNGQLMQMAAREIRFTTQKEPPPVPESIRIVPVEGQGGKVISPANIISLANHHAVPIAVKTHEETLPSDWIVVEVSDGDKTLKEQIPALGGGATVYVTVDTRSLAEGPLQVRAQARNTTTGSEFVDIEGTDPRTRAQVDWVLKDTLRPFVRVHPVRTPTRIDTQKLAIDVEPGSTVTVSGGARTLVETDESFTGELEVEVPLNPNTTNRLRIEAVDAVGNRSGVIHTDREGTPLRIVHDDTLPELEVDPVRTPTRRRRVVLRGRANERVTVVATSGGRVATSTADLNRPFRIPFALKPNAVNYIRLVATDLAGNTSPPVVLTIRHDDKPPPLRLYNRGYHRFEHASSHNPRIVVRRTRNAISGYTEPGATVRLTGHGHRVSTRAKGNGSFTIRLPFRLMPRNIHNRHEDRSWHFDLDAWDLSGNRTNERRRLTVTLEYRLPGHVYQVWHWGWFWWYWWWLWHRWYWHHWFWFYDHARHRYVWYYGLWRHHGHWHWYWYPFGWWIHWI